MVVELLEHTEDDDTHHLAFNYDDTSLVINTNTTRVLKNVSSKFAKELAILIVDLDLMSWRSFGDNKISRYSINSNAVWIQELPVSLS